jgi:hypothetical protein
MKNKSRLTQVGILTGCQAYFRHFASMDGARMDWASASEHCLLEDSVSEHWDLGDSRTSAAGHATTDAACMANAAFAAADAGSAADASGAADATQPPSTGRRRRRGKRGGVRRREKARRHGAPGQGVGGHAKRTQVTLRPARGRAWMRRPIATITCPLCQCEGTGGMAALKRHLIVDHRVAKSCVDEATTLGFRA